MQVFDKKNSHPLEKVKMIFWWYFCRLQYASNSDNHSQTCFSEINDEFSISAVKKIKLDGNTRDFCEKEHKKQRRKNQTPKKYIKKQRNTIFESIRPHCILSNASNRTAFNILDSNNPIAGKGYVDGENVVKLSDKGINDTVCDIPSANNHGFLEIYNDSQQKTSSNNPLIRSLLSENKNEQMNLDIKFKIPNPTDIQKEPFLQSEQKRDDKAQHHHHEDASILPLNIPDTNNGFNMRAKNSYRNEIETSSHSYTISQDNKHEQPLDSIKKFYESDMQISNKSRKRKNYNAEPCVSLNEIQSVNLDLITYIRNKNSLSSYDCQMPQTNTNTSINDFLELKKDIEISDIRENSVIQNETNENLKYTNLDNNTTQNITNQQHAEMKKIEYLNRIYHLKRLLVFQQIYSSSLLQLKYLSGFQNLIQQSNTVSSTVASSNMNNPLQIIPENFLPKLNNSVKEINNIKESIEISKKSQGTGIESNEKTKSELTQEKSSKNVKTGREKFLEISETFRIFYKIFPNLDDHIVTKKINLRDFLRKKLQTFKIEANEILEQTRKVSILFGNNLDNNTENLIFYYTEVLKIFVEPEKLQNNIIQMRSIWLCISLFYPEVLDFSRIIAKAYIDALNYKTTKIVNLNIMKPFYNLKNVSNKIREKADLIKNNLFSLYNSDCNAMNKGLVKNLTNFFDCCYKLLLHTFKVNEYLIAELSIERPFKVGNIIGQYHYLLLEDNIQFQNMCFSFFYVCQSFPDRIINRTQKCFYYKICLLHNFLRTSTYKPLRNKSEFFDMMKFNCIFGLSEEISKNLEFHIDVALFHWNDLKNQLGEPKLPSTDDINYCKKAITQYLYATVFKFDVENIFKAIIYKMELAFGLELQSNMTNMIEIDIFTKNLDSIEDTNEQKNDICSKKENFQNNSLLISNFTRVSKILRALKAY
ncbi:hypothetical protein EDEG_02022 [Edhazardia aedis USNM 41457]|uniref:Uncharacterized protein n=1 Tax=Edhazardia aedis (strain USNM 41457) TaxID=1003232 RepID=J9D797_EDHAE|nr:hypothetical protein EDEG_02022 [Edhazardia aedis USNM 41457]|eukprot:EJW03651.1 hypothetical protein EDEG_02022 [Edhazardia aedis USNM 41457]